jgi:hypothetical protein
VSQAQALGLDHDLQLAVLLDLALPPIDRGHRRQQVHARRESLLNERAREGRGIGIGADGGQDDRDGRGRRLAHVFSCTF